MSLTEVKNCTPAQLKNYIDQASVILDDMYGDGNKKSLNKRKVKPTF